MDGTLINSNHAIAISVNNVRKSLKLDALNEREIITTINDPAKNSINEFFFYKSSIANLILLKITLQNTLIILCFLSTCDPEILLSFIVRNRFQIFFKKF